MFFTFSLFFPRRLKKYCAYFIVSMCIAFMCLSTSCSDYVHFSSDIKELNFTFEYPKRLNDIASGTYPDLFYINMSESFTSENESSLLVSLRNWIGIGVTADEDAQNTLNGHISFDSQQVNYLLIRNEVIYLDGIKGYLAEDTCDRLYDIVTKKYQYYITLHQVYICVPKDENVYEIDISARKMEWDKSQRDIQHIIDTFKWK